MSYVLDQPAQQRRRRWPWVLVAVVTVVLVALASFLLGRSNTPPTAQQPNPHTTQSSASKPKAGLGALRWETVAGSPVPVSDEHGPHTITADGVARGYTHDKAGAVLAAMNISMRMSSAAGASTYRATVQQQTYGDQAAMLQRLSQQYSSATQEQTRPQQWWYAITAGNPRGNLVEVSLIGETHQSQAMGGYARLRRTLSWRDEDWKVQVPSPQPELVTSTTGHTRIEKPDL